MGSMHDFLMILMIASGALLLIAGAIWGFDAYQKF